MWELHFTGVEQWGDGRVFALWAPSVMGVPGEWRLYAVSGDGRTDARPVSEVDPETAALTPGPLETLRPRDRAMLAASQRVPGLLRAYGRVVLRRQRTREKQG
jgi:hypothetical protein